MTFQIPARRVFDLHPGSEQQEIVNVVRDNQLVDLNAFGDEALLQIDCLMEFNVSIVVGLDQEYGRPPGWHGGDGRRLETRAPLLLQIRFADSVFCVLCVLLRRLIATKGNKRTR